MALFDVIVLGAGHNGLTAATLMARANRRVLLLERNTSVGGLARSEEFHPGYRTTGILHDTGGLRMDLIQRLGLDAHGLEVAKERASVTLLSGGADTVTLYADTEATVQSIRAVSAKDAETYRRYRKLCDTVGPWLIKLFDSPPLPFSNSSSWSTLSLLERSVRLRQLGKETMKEFLQVAPMSVADFLDEYFETDFIKAAIALPALQSAFCGPLSSFTTLNLLLYEASCQYHVLGGPSALVTALERSAVASGVIIRTMADVSRILLSADRRIKGVELVTGEEIHAPVVAAACTPGEVFGRLLHSSDRTPRLEREVSHIRSRGTIAHVAVALCEKLQWAVSGDAPAAFVRIAPGLLEMERAFDAVKYDQSSVSPVLSIAVPTATDTTLAPPGHEVLSILSHYVSYACKDAPDVIAGRVLAQLASHTVNLRESLVAVHVATPRDIEVDYRLTGGHLFHIEHAPDQLLCRPVLSCTNYRTPITGLFLCGSGSSPGGGITCAPGVLAARTILSAT